MDRLTSVMLRTALIWLIAGFCLGGAMLVDRKLPGQWRLWFTPGHGHMLFVGWFLQFAVGVAYWLLPRRKTEARPLGYNESLGFLAVALLNAGLATRVSAEAIERAGNASDITFSFLALSAIFQIAAAAIFVRQLWPRIVTRPSRRPQSTSKGENT